MAESKAVHQSAVLEKEAVEVSTSKVQSSSGGAAGIQLTRPGQAQQQPIARDEMLMDEATRQLFMELLADRELQSKIKSPKLARPVTGGGRLGKAKGVADGSVESIGLSMGSESTSRFIIIAMLVVVVAALLYQYISRSGSKPSVPAAAHRTLAGPMGAEARRSVPRAVEPESPAPSSSYSMPTTSEASLSMFPAVVLDAGRPSQSSTHTLAVQNLTPFEMVFEVEGKDLVTRDDKTIFLPSGEIPDSVASTLVYSTRTLVVRPMQSAPLEVTLTMPAQTEARGVLVMLKAREGMGQANQSSITASVGSLITWVADLGSGGQSNRPASAPVAVSQWVGDLAQKASDSPADGAPKTEAGAGFSFGGTQ